MTRQQIENRIRLIQKKLSEARHPQDIAALNQILERLIMMEADDESLQL